MCVIFFHFFFFGLFVSLNGNEFYLKKIFINNINCNCKIYRK